MQHLILVARVVLLTLMYSLCVLVGPRPAAAAAVEGSITAPKDGEEVAGVYEVKGTVKNLTAGHELWIAVRKGKNIWPKEKAFVVAGKKWTANVDESATRRGGPYSLVLFAVDPTGQAAIADWFRLNEERQTWPAMPGIPGASALDMVDVRRK